MGSGLRSGKQRPDAEAREQAWQDEEHLLRAHDGSPNAQASRQEIAKTSGCGCHLRASGKPAQQKPKTAEEEGKGEHIGAYFEGLLTEDGLTDEKQTSHQPDSSIFQQASY